MSEPEGTQDPAPSKPVDETAAWETAETVVWPAASYWWIDQVGGYLAVRQPRVILGHAHGNADIRIHGRLSRRHAEFVCGSTGVLVQALAETVLNDQPIQATLLNHGDRLRLADVELCVHRPVAWSTTIRLDLMTPHRWDQSLSGVLLLGHSCVLGRAGDAHLPLPGVDRLLIHWGVQGCVIRGPADMRIDGRVTDGLAELSPACRIAGAWGTMAWEPVPVNGTAR